MRFLIKVSLGFLTIIIISCSSSTQLTDVYIDETFAGKQFNKILVIGLNESRMEKKSI